MSNVNSKVSKKPKENSDLLPKLRLMLAVILTLLVAFTVRLIQLQLIKNDVYQTLSDENRLSIRDLVPLRGKILAQDGTILANNRVAIDLMYFGGEVEHLNRIAHLLKLSLPLTLPDSNDPRESLFGKVISWGIPFELVPTLEELVVDQPLVQTGYFRGQPSLYLRQRSERTYPTNLATHVVGYTTEADPERFPEYKDYKVGLVGVGGIEASYQESLFGQAGSEVVETDNKGRVVRVIPNTQIEAGPGKDILLTIDPKLQAAAEKVIANSLQYVNNRRRGSGLPEEQVPRGALVALNPKTGEILAMASYPTFDPNIFTRRPSEPEIISALLNDNNFPLHNRAINAFPPASTFKLVSSLVLLDGGYISANTTYPCSSSFRFLSVTMRNWAGHWRGQYNVAEAIADSCNTFYFNAAAQTPNVTIGWASFAKNLTDYARKLGYGGLVGIGLKEEKEGIVPDDDYSRRVKGYPWRPGDTLNISIGQGDMLATPIQVAQLTATIALSGKQVKPHLVKRVGHEFVVPEENFIEGKSWHSVQEGMRLMMTNYGGRHVLGPKTFPISVAGKTGTAQNGLGSGFEHAWFTGYSPIEDPELVVTVFIQNGGSSTAVAIPVARDFMAIYWGVPLP